MIPRRFVGDFLSALLAASVALAVVPAYAVPAVDAAGWPAGTDGWRWQNGKPQGHQITGISFLDATRGWAVGDAATIMRTDDGGATWSLQHADVEWSLNAVDFAHALKFSSKGWAVGSTGLILHTDDGGSTWATQTAGTYDSLNGVDFVDASKGWAAGSFGTIIHTTDGGATWKPQISGSTSKLNGVAFADATRGWAVGDDNTILGTIDGGVTWAGQLPAGTADLNAVAFADLTHGWAVGEGGVILHTDDGSTWVPEVSNTACALKAVAFADVDHGIAVGTDGAIVQTSDGGHTWTARASGSPAWLFAIGYGDATHAVCGGTGGVLLATADGGAGWSPVSTTSTARDLGGVSFADDYHGYVVGMDGTIVRSSDAGTGWAPCVSGTSEDLYAVDSIGAFSAWAVGVNGTIVHTRDGGHTWGTQSSGTANELCAVEFKDATHGWAVGDGGTILHTGDGHTWTAQVSGTTDWLGGVSFADATHGWAVGGSATAPALLKTADGGKTWTRLPFTGADGLWLVEFVDPLHGWMMGNSGYDSVIFHSADGGLSWDKQYESADPLYTLDFTDAERGWAAGWRGTLLRTTDGGRTWVERPRPTRNSIYAITSSNGENAWGVGDWGTILALGQPAPSTIPTPPAGTFVPVEGTNRIGTAIAASKAAFTKADTVVIATAWNFPDALGGSSLAGALEAPLLLTDKDALPSAVSDEIKRLGAKNAIVLGGMPAVGANVAAQLGTLLTGSTHVTRIGGADRYETAALVGAEAVKVLAAKGRAFDGTVMVAVGDNFPDALAASPLAAAKGWPILLTRTSGLPASSSDALATLGVKKALMLGSDKVVGAPVESALKAKLGSGNVSRLAGANRYLTAIEIARAGKAAGMGYSRLAMATGENFPDALAGGVMAGRFDSVMLLTPRSSLQPDVAKLITAEKASISRVYYLGSTAALSQGVRDAVVSLLR